jgi:hypothetical protein
LYKEKSGKLVNIGQRPRTYDFRKIFAKKIGEKIGVFDEKQFADLCKK